MEMEYIVYLNNAGKSSVNGSLSDSQHVSSPTASATAVVAKKPGKRQHAYPRKRAIQACTICRIKRTKCDNSRPACSKCASLGTECNYQENDRSTYVFTIESYGVPILTPGTALIWQAWPSSSGWMTWTSFCGPKALLL